MTDPGDPSLGHADDSERGGLEYEHLDQADREPGSASLLPPGYEHTVEVPDVVDHERVRGGSHRQGRRRAAPPPPGSSRSTRSGPAGAGTAAASGDRASGSSSERQSALSGRPPAGSGSGRQPSARDRRRAERDDHHELDDLHRHHPVLIGLAIVLVALVIAGFLVFRWAEDQINPGGRLGAKVTVTIPPNSSTAQIGAILARAGVIHGATLFKYYVKIDGANGLLAGTYNLPRNETYNGVINLLQAGPKIIIQKLVIPEGFTLQQIAARVAALPGLHLSAAKFLAASSSGTVRSPYEPAGVNNLEGLVFPDTYDVRRGETEVDVMQELVGQFNDEANTLGLSAGATKLGMSPYQVVEVASIVEREAQLDGDRGNVASTLYNRLKAGMPLGADSTQTYYLRLSDPTLQPSVAQLDQPSPYNTRLNTGLPPTPIANPGIPSLKAAIGPPATSYLYFVETNPDGQLSFASDNAGFIQLQQECQAAHLC